MLFETMDGVDLLIMGAEQPLKLDLEAIGARMEELDVRLDLARVDMRRPIDVLSLFRLGPTEVARLVDGAPRNTDDNARVEFSAPKTLGMPTIEANIEMLYRHRADLLDYLDPAVDDPVEQDRLRLQLAESWLYRGDYELAIEAAEQVSDEQFRERADRILAHAQDLAPSL